MPYTRHYHAVIPVEPDADLEVLRWLTRESFERRATSDCLHIVDYVESTLPVADIPPKAAKQLARPLTDYQWLEFKATASNA